MHLRWTSTKYKPRCWVALLKPSKKTPWPLVPLTLNSGAPTLDTHHSVICYSSRRKALYLDPSSSLDACLGQWLDVPVRILLFVKQGPFSYKKASNVTSDRMHGKTTVAKVISEFKSVPRLSRKLAPDLPLSQTYSLALWPQVTPCDPSLYTRSIIVITPGTQSIWDRLLYFGDAAFGGVVDFLNSTWFLSCEDTWWA